MPAAGRTARRTQRAPDRVRARAARLGRAGCALPRRSLLGLAAGDVLGYLNRCGYDCRAASVGIISSVGPRASSTPRSPRQGRLRHRARAALRSRALRHGISRAARAPGWGADKPVDLVGHSFGGATAYPCSCSRTAAPRRLPRRPRPQADTLAAVHRQQDRLQIAHALVVAIAAPHEGSTSRRAAGCCECALDAVSRHDARARSALALRTYMTSSSTSSASPRPDRPITYDALQITAQNRSRRATTL